MRILIAGGGTAGHINPAIAVARYIRTRQPSAEILFVGAQGGMEEKLVGEAGFPLKTFAMRGFLHKLTPKAIWFNLDTLRRMAASF
ncbi:MAG TPA: UDP-N-acetylglucosamine--N-acetylmuramyl-(pentapeptide) pyrophosphoryl-undecaprenol N-acetylglucosamine transferase, partial [Clostridiales bacterium]|nr:UDP-N-acetylglucosamine--N-acetylmuramyl-(pentapeptide) pyrophosphoryl-undecaprenol N-acetylglucosamine transferase [Clostridiales bacterium]